MLHINMHGLFEVYFNFYYSLLASSPRECMILLLIERCRASRLKALSVAAEEGWTSNTFLTAEYQLGSPSSWTFHHSTFFHSHLITTSWVTAMYCGSSLTTPSMVLSLWRNGKILRASTVARVGLNHWTVTGHITLAALKAATASIRSTLNFR